MRKILAIELEGFQSINRPTRIAFSDITLLYGTNSAGKSAVSDALAFFRTVSDTKTFNAEEVYRLIDRWASWHSTVDNEWQLELDAKDRVADLQPYRVLKACIEYELPAIDPWNFALDGWQNSSIHGSYEQLAFGGEEFLDQLETKQPLTARIELRYSIRGSGHFEHYGFYLLSCTVLLNGKAVATLDGNCPLDLDREKTLRLSDYFAHVYEGPFKSHYIGGEEINLTLAPNLQGKVDKKTYSYSGKAQSRVYWSVYEVESNNFFQTRLTEDSGQGKVRLAIKKNFRDICYYFFGSLHDILRKAPPVVVADRTIPDLNKVFSIVDFRYSEGWWPDNEVSPVGPIIAMRDKLREERKHWFDIAQAAYGFQLKEALSHDEWGSDWSRDKIAKKSEGLSSISYKEWAQRFEKVNEYLKSELFDTNAYEVKASVVLLVPLDLRDPDPKDSYYLLSQPAAVTLHLIDSSGKVIALRDVGSGIPFVIPILITVTQSGLKFIQQPELHLHPKLQGRLADVFIDAIKHTSGPLIIETHSEHLLLRLLRRIRQTTKGKTSVYTLNPDQLAVYYFDGEIGGGTIVTQQLVTPLGDFYNDWPKGFFNERDKDLFDD